MSASSIRLLPYIASVFAAAFGVAAPDSAMPAETLRTPGDEVVSLRPEGEEWSCSPSRRTGDGFTLAEIRCRRPFGHEALLLYAKDYEGPSETVSGICARDWKAYYQSILPSITALSAKVVKEGTRSVCVVDAEGLSSRGVQLRLREWYVVTPGHVLLVTAAGPTAVVTSQEQAVTKWRDGVVFRAAKQNK